MDGVGTFTVNIPDGWGVLAETQTLHVRYSIGDRAVQEYHGPVDKAPWFLKQYVEQCLAEMAEVETERGTCAFTLHPSPHQWIF